MADSSVLATAGDFPDPPPKRARLEVDDWATPRSTTEGDEDLFDGIYDTPEKALTSTGAATSQVASANASSQLAQPGIASDPVAGLASTTSDLANVDSAADVDVADDGLEIDYDDADYHPEEGLSSKDNTKTAPVEQQRPANSSRELGHTHDVTPSQSSVTSRTLDAEENEVAIDQSNGTKQLEDGERAAGHTSTTQADGQVESSTEAPIGTHEEFRQAAEANKNDPNAEFQFDSEEDDSDDSDTDSDSDSDSDSSSEAAEDLATALEDILDGDASSPEEVRDNSGKTTQAYEPFGSFEKPDVTIGEKVEAVELGNVDKIIDNMVLIKAKTSGDYFVLEHGSIVCLEDKTVIGRVAELIGRVQGPMYVVGFPTAQDMHDLGVTVGTATYYPNDPELAPHVFTEKLQAQQAIDEDDGVEGAEEEVYFSDDEAEAAYMKQKKEEQAQQRAMYGDERANQPEGRERRQRFHKGKGGQNERGRGGRGRVDRGRGDRGRGHLGRQTDIAHVASSLNYDDDGADSNDSYTPLKRPDDLNTLPPPRPPMRGLSDRGHMGRGRGDRGRGGRGRGDRGRGDRGRQFTPYRADQREFHSPRSDASGSGYRRDDHRDYHDHKSYDERSNFDQPGSNSSPYSSQHEFAPPAPASSAWQAPYGGFNQVATSPSSYPPAAANNAYFSQGAFVNPAFYNNQAATIPPPSPAAVQQFYQQFQQWQQSGLQAQPHQQPQPRQASDPSAWYQQQANTNYNQAGSSAAPSAFQSAQEQLAILRRMHGRPGSS